MSFPALGEGAHSAAFVSGLSDSDAAVDSFGRNQGVQGRPHVDGLYARARENGAEIVLEIQDTDYGSRDFTVRDPEGNLWAFGTYRPSD